jgi:ABC-type Na+ efflux pump permease subunit
MFAALRSLFSFPLLTKELTERAARPRTYWLRIGAALLLYGGFWFNNDDVLRHAAMDAGSVLGAGRQMFEATVVFLFICIYAFVPAMLCGVITHEKERDSLVLLLLTRMRSWQIVLQKYFGGLIPALTILFLAMPLVAVAYAYGGVTTEQVVTSLAILVLAILQIGAIAVWASSRFRTTVAAFLVTYFVGGAVFGLPALCIEIGKEIGIREFGNFQRWMAYAHVPPCVFIDSLKSWKPFDTPSIGIGCFNIAAVGLIFFLAAIIQLPRHAFDPPKNRIRRLFAAVDRWVHAANRWIGSITFGRREDLLPGNLPIVWREKRARALARPEYLARLLVAIMIPVVLVSLFVIWTGDQDGLTVEAGIAGGLAILILSTTASNSILNERVNQTFEVLLTTPMSAMHILRQKARALRPLVVVLAVPLLTICTIEFIMEHDHTYNRRTFSFFYPEWIYPVCVLLTLAVYLPLFSWFAIWMGLLCKTRIRAIVTTLIVLAVWFVGPVILVEETDLDRRQDEYRYVLLLSPMVVPALNEEDKLDIIEPREPWLPVFLNFSFYGGILFVIRSHCLISADRYLRR